MIRGTRLFSLALAAIVTVTLHAQQNVASLAEIFAGMRAGDSIAVPANTVIRQGNAEFTLSSGLAAPVVAGKETIGYFFKGRGSYAYRITDKEELPVASSNAKRAANIAVEQRDGVATVSDTFAQAFFWIAGAPLPKIEGAGGESLAAAFDEHRKAFDREYGAPAAHTFILQRLNAPSKTAFRVQLSGGKEETVYLYDAADRDVETLYVFERGSGRISSRYLFPVTISERPVNRPFRKAPEPRFQLTAIDYTLIGDGKDAKLDITETFTGARPGINALRLDLFDTMWDEDVARKLRVTRAKDEKGNELPIEHRNDQLLVSLPATLAPNATTKITFSIEGDFLIRPSGDSFWQLGVMPWFPQPDLVEQYYTVHSVVKVKKPFHPFAPGKTVRRVEEGDFNVVENTIDKPVQFAVAHAGKYAWEEETRNGVTIRVATYAGKNTRAMKQLTNLAFGIIESYQFFLGPFPFPELNIIEMNTWGYGQAPPGTMFITKEAFNPIQGDLNQFFSQGINERFAHEIAHQYWGHVVKMPSGEEQWMTESFAEYSAAIFLRKLKKDGTYESLIRHWQKNANEASKHGSIPTANRIRVSGDGMTQMRNRTALVYDKGAYMLAALHQELGDQLFLSFLKSYQTNFRWKFGTSESVAAVLQFITKKDYTKFMDDYFWGTEMPKVTVK